jgi:hypothetical protein
MDDKILMDFMTEQRTALATITRKLDDISRKVDAFTPKLQTNVKSCYDACDEFIPD